MNLLFKQFGQGKDPATLSCWFESLRLDCTSWEDYVYLSSKPHPECWLYHSWFLVVFLSVVNFDSYFPLFSFIGIGLPLLSLPFFLPPSPLPIVPCILQEYSPSAAVITVAFSFYLHCMADFQTLNAFSPTYQAKEDLREWLDPFCFTAPPPVSV